METVMANTSDATPNRDQLEPQTSPLVNPNGIDPDAAKAKPRRARPRKAVEAGVSAAAIAAATAGAIVGDGVHAADMPLGEAANPLPPPPPIQPAGGFPSLDEAIADMSQPPPTPPMIHTLLPHSTKPPAASFRVIPREGKGLILTMVTLPFGAAKQGEPFTHPISARLLNQLMKECPTLKVKRYEIRLVVDAAGNPSFLEVPADPAGNELGEQNRLSLLRVLEYAEQHWTLAVKENGGRWGRNDGAAEAPLVIPTQSFRELADLTYRGAMFVNMDHPTLVRFKRKMPDPVSPPAAPSTSGEEGSR
jgi:hypothetical protein